MFKASVNSLRQANERAITRDRAHIACILHHRGLFQTTIIWDYSHTGIGLVGARGIMVGDRITIELLSGEKLTGTIRWWLAGRCGLEFDAPIEPDSSAYQRLETARHRRDKRLKRAAETFE